MTADWLTNLFSSGSVAQTILLLCLISAGGLALGRVRVGKSPLGGSVVFFAAIAAGHFFRKWGVEMDVRMMDFAKNFGLVIFVYSLGLQCGPGFFASLRKGGLKLSFSALLTVLLGTGLALGLALSLGIGMPEMVGILSGAVTSTPALIAAQETVLDMDPSAAGAANTVASAYAVAYPFSVLGVILVVILMRRMFPASAEKSSGKSGDIYTSVTEVEVRNPDIFGRTVSEIVGSSGFHFVISRVWRGEDVQIPMSDTVIREGDRLMLICDKDDFRRIDKFFGSEIGRDWNRPDVDWNVIDPNLVSRHLHVTKKEVVGRTLGELKLRNKFGVNITRILRAGITLVPDAGTMLQFGDSLTVVGGEERVRLMGRFVGDEEKLLDEPHLVSLLLGVALGVLLGSIPFFIPGMSSPFRVGLAGGSIIMGILMGAFAPRLRVATYTTRSTSLMMQRFGITFFFASLGLGVGGNFVETVFCLQGLKWAALSVVLAMVPLLVMSVVNDKLLKMDFSQNVGTVCGVATNPNALNHAGSMLENDSPAASYATVYPIVVFLRVFLAQALLLLF